MLEQPVELEPEDAKLVMLARATRARTGGLEGAAVRDETGRTYAAATVSLPSLSLSAVQAAVATAVASGAHSLEAAAVVAETSAVSDADLAVVRDLGGPGRPVFYANADGEVTSTATT